MSSRLRVVVRFRRARSRLVRFVTGSLAAHGVLVAVILVLPMMRQAPQTFDDAMVVALAGPLPGRAAAPAPAATQPAAPAPAPPKAPEPKEAHTVREVPKPTPKPKESPKKKEEAPTRSPAPSAPAGPPQDTPPPETPATGEAKGGGAGATGPTGVTAVLGGGDASLGFYGAAVKAALESAWMKPFLEDQGETYSATVSFVIARDGTARDVRIAESSGVPSLDRSAMRAVIEASPFPPIPPSWTGDSLPATMRFDLTPEGR
jgi:periplasmic protein TonB